MGQQICEQFSLKKNFNLLIFQNKYCKSLYYNLRIFLLLFNMREYQFQVRVRYAETDQMGVVYHGNYAQYFEMGRVEWLRNMGVSYKWMEENGVMLPVVTLTMNYKKPARYDDLLTVKTIFKSQTSVKIEFDYEIYNEANELLTTGYSMLVFVDMKSGRPMLPPSYVSEKIKTL